MSPETDPLLGALDREADVPLGVQLAWRLRALIVAGALPSGHRLPAVRELAQAAGVNVNTVRAVYARLEAEELIELQHGRGTFVAERAHADRPLADVAARAARDAEAAGVDLREVAAALYVGAAGEADTARPAAPGGARQRRRALQREIGRLEEALAAIDLPHLHALRPDADDAPSAPAAPRVVPIAELEAQRDELAARLALLREARREQRERIRFARAHGAADETTATSATTSSRPGVRLRWSSA